jgi:4-azaleucine resistance transporter AzlC
MRAAGMSQGETPLHKADIMERGFLRGFMAPITTAGLMRGAKRAQPIVVSDFAFGIAYGVLSRQAGMSLTEALLMSGLVSAGSAQVAALGMWSANLPVASLILTTLLINLRHLLMGAALAPRLKRLAGWQAFVSAYFLYDESFALSVTEPENGDGGGFLIGSGAALFFSWVGATALGQLAGQVLPDPARWGLDFAFPAAFAALLVSLWKGRSDLLPWLAAAGVAVAASFWLPGMWYVLLGGLAGGAVGALRRGC